MATLAYVVAAGYAGTAVLGVVTAVYGWLTSDRRTRSGGLLLAVYAVVLAGGCYLAAAALGG